MNDLTPINADDPCRVYEGEVIPPDAGPVVSVQDNPFSTKRVVRFAKAGDSITDIVLSCGLRPTFFKHTTVWIGDDQIPIELWDRVRPKAGTNVFVRVKPGGGGNFMKQLLMLVVVAAASFLSPLIVGALGITGLAAQILTPLIGLGITMLGAWLINMLIPPPKKKLSEHALLGAIRNRFNPFGPIPRIVGRRRTWPVLGAHPYTESSNGKRYLRAVLLVGYGPLKISDIMIGDTPIDVYDNIIVETREGWFNEDYGAYRLETVLRYDFDTDGDAEGWTGVNCTLTVENGVMRIVDDGSEAQHQVISPNLLYFPGVTYTHIRAKVRRVLGTGFDGDVFYQTDGHGYDALYKKAIGNGLPTNGEWVVLEWDMSNLTAGGSDWLDNLIKRFRIDTGSTSATSCEIDWIEVGYPVGKDAERQLFTNSVSENNVAAKLPWGTVVTRTTDPDCIAFGVDIQLPGGIGKMDDDGDIDDRGFYVEVRYREVGTNDWLTPKWSSNIKIDGTEEDGYIHGNGATQNELVFGGWAYFPSEGQYEVRCVRTTDDFENEGKKWGTSYWQTLRSIKKSSPINDDVVGGLATISIRAKATDQFQSFPDEINCVAESYLPVPGWNGSDKLIYDTTQNPAWAFYDLLRHRGVDRIIEDTKIDFDALRSWATGADEIYGGDFEAGQPGTSRRWRVGGQLENGSVFENCRDIAAHGRATFIVNNGLYSVVRDIEQTVPVQLITPKNSFGYNGMKQFIDMPHALRIHFVNADKQWQDDEIIVYDDGYDATTATKFETLDFAYCTSSDQAWREGRYHLAVGKLRPEEHRISMDIENLRCTLGDYVMLTHDVLSIGSGTGRVTARTGTTTISDVTLDEEINLDKNRTYGVRYRRGDTGTVYTASLTTPGTTGAYNVFTFATPIASASAPLVGDILVVGELDLESAPMMVKRIEPGPNMTATLSLVDAQPGVWGADTGVIPPFNSYITEETPVKQKKPPAPSFTLVSDETACIRLSNGRLQDNIRVRIAQMPASKVGIDGFQVQWRKRRVEEMEWSETIPTPYGNRTIFLNPVRAGKTYDVRVRSVSEFGIASDWTEELGHVVIGKTTPPGDVQNFIATPSAQGVQLEWDANTDLDLRGYIVKLGTDWETAEKLSTVTSGTSLFVKLDTSIAQTFLIRAVDVIGLQSETTTIAVSPSIVPSPISRLQAFVQEDIVVLKWRSVKEVGVRYEVRIGPDWQTARLIGTVANTEITAKVPNAGGTVVTFWVDTLSIYGAYSGDERYRKIRMPNIDNRNVIATKDLQSLSYPGVLHDCTIVSTTIALDDDASGNQYNRGEYIYPLDLGVERRVRTWCELSLTTTAGTGTTWQNATFAWNFVDTWTWLGSVSLYRAGDITPRISVYEGAPSNMVEGFRFNGNGNGINSTSPATITNVGWTLECQFTTGLALNRLSALDYTLTIPSTFTIAVDYRWRAPIDNDNLVFKLIGTSIAMWLCYDAQREEFGLFDHNGDILSVPYTKTDDDVVTILVTQSATKRALYVISRRAYDIVSAKADIAAIGAFSSIAMHQH